MGLWHANWGVDFRTRFKSLFGPVAMSNGHWLFFIFRETKHQKFNFFILFSQQEFDFRMNSAFSL